MQIMGDRKDQSVRPFYELPAHYKPCSKIIKETQMQLQYSGKVRESDLEYANTIARHGTSDFAGIRPVHTKRPFTPRDSVNLWGSSARKRPPSAITLSRLVLDESDESRPGSSASAMQLSPTGFTEAGRKSSLEITHRKFQSLSLSPGHSADESINGGVDNDGETRARSISVSSLPEQINNLEAAIEYLDWFVDNSKKKGQIGPKSEIVTVLKRINANISSIHVVEKLKTRLLKLLFRLVERNQNDEDILFWSSFILLHCHITGNNLTTVYKMIFKASKCKDYLGTIKDSDYLQTFLNTFSEVSPLTQTETMIYGYGILKFLCTEDFILFRVIELNLIEIMATHVKALNEGVEKRNGVISENMQNGMFQLTSILRNVVGIPSCLDHVAELGLLEEVCNSLLYTMKDADVLSNIVRILSVVSEHELCGEVISENTKLCAVIVKVLQVWHSKEDIIVRLMYCLGNILGRHSAVRIKLFIEPLSYQMIIQIICYYLENSTPSSEDILVKSIRVLANWSLDPEIGAEFSEEEKLNEILNTILNSEAASHELLICTVATLNNICYYKDCGSSNEISRRTVESILVYLNAQDIELRTEVTKVLGNLTRNVDVRPACSEHIGALLISLEENEECLDLLYATIGVLINVIADNNCKSEFIRKQGLHYLIDLLDRTHNVRLSLMMSQLLWNLILSSSDLESDGNVNVRNYFHQEEINELCQTLARKMEEFSDGGGESPTPAFSEDCQDFLSVSSSLYDKLTRTLVD